MDQSHINDLLHVLGELQEELERFREKVGEAGKDTACPPPPVFPAEGPLTCVVRGCGHLAETHQTGQIASETVGRQ